MVRKVKRSTPATKLSQATRKSAAVKRGPASKRSPVKGSEKLIKNKRDLVLQVIVVIGIILSLYFAISWLERDDGPVTTFIPSRSHASSREVADSIARDAINERLKIEEANKSRALESAKPKAWQINAAYADLPVGVPRLVIIIDDLGYLPEASKRLADMEGPLTLAYLPYGTELEAQTGYVLLRGHELLVHMPMAPKSSDTDPGPVALVTGLSKDDFTARLDHNLNRFTGFVGINNHMGSLLTERTKEMSWVMEALSERGLLFLDSVTTSKSQAQPIADALGVPSMRRDVFIDNERSESLIIEQLEKAKSIAMQRGVAVVIGHPYPETLDALEKWLPKLNSREIVLAPLSAVMQEKYQN